MEDLYIVGAGGFGRETAWVIRRINSINPVWNFIGFVDDNVSLYNAEIDGYKVIGPVTYLNSLSNAWAVCAIGNTAVRKEVIKKLENIRFAKLIDPSARISDRVSIGEGSIVCAGSIITVDVNIGKHNIINLNCTIGHDAVLSDFVTLYPSVNISGQVSIGTLTECGTGSQIIQGLTIAQGVSIGAGAVVVKNIEDDGIYAGCPARKIKGR